LPQSSFRQASGPAGRASRPCHPGTIKYEGERSTACLQFFHKRDRFAEGGTVNLPRQLHRAYFVTAFRQLEDFGVLFFGTALALVRQVNLGGAGGGNFDMPAEKLDGLAGRRADAAPPQLDNPAGQHFDRIVPDSRFKSAWGLGVLFRLQMRFQGGSVGVGQAKELKISNAAIMFPETI
jgi:hypothetical protein